MHTKAFDVYSADNADGWIGTAPFKHASGIWGRGRMVEFLAGQIQPGQNAIDLGCGAGLLTSYLCAMVGEEGSVTGYDDSPSLIDAANDLTDSFPKLNFELIDVCRKFSAENYSTDWFVSFMLLQNLSGSAIREMMGEVHRCLRPLGSFACLTLHPNFFEEEWDLSFISYDKTSIADWRSHRQRDFRIEGRLSASDGSSKPAFAYPHSRTEIEKILSDHNMTIVDEREICVERERIEKRFGQHSICNLPNGPLFWIFSAKYKN